MNQLRTVALIMTAVALCSCSSTTGRVALTPLTGARDLVDVPLVTLTNVFEFWAGRSDPTPTPSVGVGVSTGGVSPFAGIGLGYYVFKPISWILGGVDYVVCRSLWPNWPRGISPWVKEGHGWGTLYFPSSRTLWSDDGVPPGYDPPSAYGVEQSRKEGTRAAE